MSLEFYLWLHIAGMIIMISGLSAAIVVSTIEQPVPKKKKIMPSMMHGIGLLLSFFAGFGLLAKLQYPFPWPLFVWAKIAIWLILGGSIGLIYKQKIKPAVARLYLLGLFFLAAYLGIFKPFVGPLLSGPP